MTAKNCLRKGQASLEYLIIVSFAIIVIIPSAYFFLSYSQQTNDELTFNLLEDVGRTIVNNAEDVFYLGTGSKTAIEVKIPKDLKEASIIDQRELVFKVSSSSGDVELVFISDVNITNGDDCVAIVCSLAYLNSSGLQTLVLESTEKRVKISRP